MVKSNIIYEEELVTEEVYRGTFAIDERLTPKQQRRKIFNMMRKEAGIIVENESEYQIAYEGVSDNDGISETQTTEFVVTRTYMKSVPVKVTREEVYKGTYVLDGLRVTPEEQRESIFNLMRNEGYDIENEDEYEIGFEGADDNEGISETQVSEYVVYHIKKERIDEDELNAFENDSANDIPDLYNEMLEIRDELKQNQDSSKLEELASRVDSVTDRVDEIIENKIKEYGIFEQEIESLSKQIKEVEEKIIAKEEEYETQYEELKGLMEVQEATTEEEQEELRRKKERYNDKLLTISKEKDRLKRELSSLKGKRTKLRNDLETAKMLGLSADEYKDLTSNLRKKDILDAIYQEKGLGEIIAIPARERTKEQKKQLRDAKEEIMAELAKLQVENPEKSVLENIEALYGINQEMPRTYGRERLLLFNSKKLDIVKANNSKLPAKVAMKAKEDKVDYVPGDMPEDLKEAFANIDREEKVVATGRVHIDDIYLRGLSEAETQARYEEEAIKDAASNGVVYNPETMSINFSGAEVDEAASDIQYQGYSIIETTQKEPEEPEYEEEEVVEENVIMVGRVHIDDIYLRGLSEAETLAKYEEEVIKDLEGKGIIYNPDTMSINFSGASVDEAASDIQYQGYAVIEKTVTKVKKPVVNPQPVEPEEKVEEVTEEVVEEKQPEPELSRDIKDKITIFKDDTTGKQYVRMPVFARFDIEPTIERVKIEGTLCSEISAEEVTNIKDNMNNDYSPYIVDEVNIHGVNKEEKEEETKEVPNRDLQDKITIFKEKETGKMYARMPVFTRFGIEPTLGKVRINGTLCSEILEDEYKEIKDNMNNDYSPYIVDEVEVSNVERIENKVEPEVIVKNEELELTSANLLDKITIFKDEQTGKMYARMPVFTRFDIEPTAERVRINGTLCSEIQEEDYNNIKENMNNDYSPYIVSEVPVKDVEKLDGKTEEPKPIGDVDKDNKGEEKDPIDGPTVIPTNKPEEKKTEPQMKPKQPVKVAPPKKKHPEQQHVKPHVEEIIAKLTKGLDIHAKDSKRYNASNIKIAKSFKQELSSGNYLYNIVHFVPTIIKTAGNFFAKLSGKLLTTKRAKEAMETIKERLDSLSEEELEVLFEEYKGSQLKTDMNNQINSLILDRLRRFGLEKVEAIDDQIKNDYANLFVILGQLKTIEAQLEKTKDKDKRKALEDSRDRLNEQAASHIRKILDNRVKANNLLSGGVHGLEEDFKAVSTKMSYVGMRFGKSHDFDDELQQQLGNFGRNLNIALATNNNEAIVQNFMGLESCYFDNTEIRGSIVGKRSVGSKYYSPLAEQFDYRDDPFIRDLFTTAAVAAATVSAVNALRQQQILAEHNRQIAEHNEKVADANAMNEATVRQARETGQSIADKRDTFREGMASQSEHDILTNANTRERSHLDSTNWQFNDDYHHIDPAGHEAYNQYGDRISSEINSITADYAKGALTAEEALAKIEYLSSNANTTLNGVINDCLPILRQYAQTHPQFDLHAVEESMQYISAHPNAIANMNHAMVDVTEMGESLTTLQAAHIEALALLPPTMSSSIIAAASSAVLAGMVASKLSKGPLKKNQYGNEVTEMMADYLANEEAEEEERVRTR